MLFIAVAVVCIILAVLVFYLGARTLAKLGWVMGFIRGLAGLLFIGLAVVLVLSGLDLLSYKQMFSEKPLLTISFEKLEEQKYKATVSHIEEGTEETFDLNGEQWQIDARVIRWKGIVRSLGAQPGYRLDRLSGRYYSLEDERRKDRSVHTLKASEYGLDLWAWVQENGRYLPLFDAVYGSATYLPMRDGAIFQVAISTGGLLARPMNEVAEEAIHRWE